MSVAENLTAKSAETERDTARIGICDGGMEKQSKSSMWERLRVFASV